MSNNTKSFALTKNEDRFAFFKLLCLNLKYIYNFQEKFSNLLNKMDEEQFSSFFNNQGYKDELNSIINGKNKELFDHFDIYNSYFDINTTGPLNFYYSSYLDNNDNMQFNVSFAKRYLEDHPHLIGNFTKFEDTQVNNNYSKKFVYGFQANSLNSCLNNFVCIGALNRIDGEKIIQLDNGCYKLTFLDFFVLQTFALQTYGIKNNVFPGSDVLNVFGDKIVDKYLAEEEKQNECVCLPEKSEISSLSNDIYDWAMEKGREILQGKIYKFENVPVLSFLDRAGNFQFKYKNCEKEIYGRNEYYLNSGNFYKNRNLLPFTTLKEGHVNNFNYIINRITFDDLLRMRVETYRSGDFIESIVSESHYSDAYKEQEKSTKERLTYLLPMLAAQIQTDYPVINYFHTYELLYKEIEFFKNCTALLNCFIDKHKTSLLISTI